MAIWPYRYIDISLSDDFIALIVANMGDYKESNSNAAIWCKN